MVPEWFRGVYWIDGAGRGRGRGGIGRDGGFGFGFGVGFGAALGRGPPRSGLGRALEVLGRVLDGRLAQQQPDEARLDRLLLPT